MRPISGSWVSVSVLAALLLVSSAVWANGNYSHMWIATDAIGYLEEGPLLDLLGQDGLLEVLQNGAMFPDGGYAVDDGYGEMGHWEPFHLTYLDWIRTTYEPPWSDEAARHVAFLMGMAAHGMSDQLYDGMYLQRHKHYDEHGDSATQFGVDGATDVCFAATQGPAKAPPAWVPAEVMASLFGELGHEVAPEKITQGQTLIGFVVGFDSAQAQDPDVMAEYMEVYPWACGNQDNPAVPGSPVTHGPAVARYWEALWGRLHGHEAFDEDLLGAFFTGGTPYEQPQDGGTPDAWVSFALPRGLEPGTVTPDTVTVVGEDGLTHPFGLHVYYGRHSHLVNIKPQEDWAPDMRYDVTIAPPIQSWEGTELAATHTFFFSTGLDPAPPPEDVVEPGDASEPDSASADLQGQDVEEATPSEDVAIDTSAEDHGAAEIMPEVVLDAASPDSAVADVGVAGSEESGRDNGCSYARHAGAPSRSRVGLALFLLSLLACARRSPA